MAIPTGTPEETKQKTAAAYNSAADGYDHPANSFWDRFGRRTVERLNLSPGVRVLDVCCGAGASAIPAARDVGPDGSVLGVDLADNLLELARTKAQRDGLTNVEFRKGDLLALGLPSQSFDAVICIFGIFFLPDMEAATNELWGLVRPGGKLAITTWGPRLFEPANTIFWDSIRSVRPDLYKSFNPWDRISDPESVRLLLKSAGASMIEVLAESGTQPVNSADDWWSIIRGSGYRGTVDQLEPAEYENVRRQNLVFIERANVQEVEANVVYGVATRTK